MIQPYLDEIGATIISYNKYFNRYFTNVEQSEELGYVHNGDEIVFPNDTYGNYFYLRIPSKIAVTYDAINNNGNFNAVGLNSMITLVAMVKDADPQKLALNLMSTVGRACNYTKKFTQILIHNEDVIATELQQCSENVIAKALQCASDDFTLISINFTLTINQPFLQLNCITNPCKSCS
jgi:hypothetical protein